MSNFSAILWHTVCESNFIRWHQFSWFLQNAVIFGFLNSWFQTLQVTINWENCISLVFNFHGLSEPQNPQKLESHN